MATSRRLREPGAIATLGLILTFIAGALCWCPAGTAATYTWDSSGVGGTMDGIGTWDTLNNYWWNGSADTNWNGTTDTALFGAAAGSNPFTVTVAPGGVSVGGITFQNQAYTVSGDTITLAGATPTITVNASGGTISSPLAGTAGFTKAGAGALYLTSGNGYSGTTTVSAGALTASAVNALGTGTLAISGGTANINADQSVGAVTLSSGLLNAAANLGTGNLTIAGGNLDNLSGGPITLNNSTQNWNGSFTFLGSNPLNLGTGPVTLGASPTVTVSGNTLTVPGSIAGGGKGLADAGAGTLVLSGNNNTFGGNINVYGTMVLSGTNIDTGSSGIIYVNKSGAGNGILKINGGYQQFNDFYVAGSSSSYGAVYQSGGNVNVTDTTYAAYTFIVGYGSSSYGYYRLSGGALSANEFELCRSGSAVADVCGGTLSTNLLAIGAATSPPGLLNLTSGVVQNQGSLNLAGRGNSFFNVGGGATPAAYIGPSTSTVGSGVVFNGAGKSNTVIVNLLTNGTLTASQVSNNGSGGIQALNFNGGTLKATPANLGGSFIPPYYGGPNAAGLNIYLYSSGGTIDDSGTSITVGIPIRAPASTGVTTITLSNSGSGYIGAPLVQITGGSGVPATAVANMVDDGTGHGTYEIASITITSPGSYTSPPSGVSLTGGGASTAASGFTVNTGDNTSGGLTKAGNGTLTLSPTTANTYSGGTTIQSGVLQLGSSAALGTGGLNTGGGTLDLNKYGITLPALTGNGWVTDMSTSAVTTTLTVNPAVSTTSLFGGVIANGTAKTLALTTSGAGILALTGNNTYSGATTIGAGTLQIGNGGNSGALLPASTITNNAALVFSRSDDYGGAISNTIGGSGWLGLNSGSLVLVGPNTYRGGTTINGGTLAVLSGGALGTGNITVAPGALLDVSALGSGYSLTAGAWLSAGRTTPAATDILGSLNVNSAVLTQSASNSTMTLSGNLSMSGGTVSYLPGDQISLPSGALSFGAADYIAPAVPLLRGTYTLFTDPLGVPANPQNYLHLVGPNGGNPTECVFSVSGGTAVTMTVAGNPQNLQWSGAGSVWYSGTAAGTNWYNPDTSSSAYFYNDDNVTFDNNGSANPHVTISGTVQPGSITVNNPSVNYTIDGGTIGGPGVLAKSGQGLLVLGGTNSFTGGVAISGGTLQLGSNTALGASSNALSVVSGSALDLHGFSPTVGALSGNGLIDNVAGGSPVLTLGSGDGSSTFSGTIQNTSGSIKLVKTGSGALVLSGYSTYGGGTTLNAGSLVLANLSGSALGSGTLTLNGGTLAAGPSGGTASGLVKAGSGPHVIAPGAGISGGYGTLNLNGGLTTSASTTLDFNLGTATNGGVGYVGDLLNVGGTLTIGAKTFFDFTTPSGTGDYCLIGVKGTLSGGTASLKNVTFPYSYYYQYSLSTAVDSGYIDLIVATAPNFNGFATWTSNGSTSWSSSANWLDTNGRQGVPGTGPGDTATFDGTGSATAINLNVPARLAALSFSTLNYSLSGSSVLTLSNTNTGTANVTVNSGMQAISAPVVLASNISIAVANGSQLTISGNISESAAGQALLLSGDYLGTLVLRGSNSYSGGTTLNAGTLRMGHNRALGAVSGGLTFNNYAVLDLNGFSPTVGALNGTGEIDNAAGGGSPVLTIGSGGGSGTFSGSIQNYSGSTALVKTGSGTQVLSGFNSYNGGTTLQAEVLNFTYAALPLNASPPSITFAGGTLQWAAGNAQDVSAGIAPIASGQSAKIDTNGNSLSFATGLSGSGGLTKIGDGMLTLAASNRYSGSTVVSGGTLQCVPTTVIAGANATASDYYGTHYPSNVISGYGMTPGAPYDAVMLYSTCGTDGANMWLTSGGPSEDTSGSWIDIDLGSVQTISGFQLWNYNKSDFLFAGVNQARVLADGSAVLNPSGGTAFTFAKATGDPSYTGQYCQFGAPVTAEHIRIYTDSAWGNGQYVGLAQILFTPGGVPGNLPTGTPLSVADGATVDLNGSIQQVGSLDGSGTVANSYPAPATLLVGTAGAATFSGSIQGNTALVMNGAGVQTLTGTSSYSGGTTLQAGVLNFTRHALPDDAGAPSITFVGGTLQWATGNTEDVSAGIAPIAAGQTAKIDTNGNSVSFASTLSGSGGLNKIGAGTLTLVGTNTYSGGTIISGGKLVLADRWAIEDGTSLTVGDPNAFAAPIVQSPVAGAVAAVAPVPEPGTLALAAAGAVAALGLLRRRMRTR